MDTQIRIVAIDIDHTTLTDDHRLLPGVIEAVERATRSGILVIPATARPPQGLRFISNLGLSGPVVCFNGAWTGTLEGDRVSSIQSHLMDLVEAAKVIAAGEKLGLNPCWFTSDCMYTLYQGPLVERERRATGVTAKTVGMHELARHEILKVLLLESLGHSAGGLAEKFPSLSFFYSGRALVEVVEHGVSKQKALAQLARKYGVDASEVAMVGDSENDIEAIQWAGLGIAMGNAVPGVIGVADMVVGTNEEAGLAQALNHIVDRNEIATTRIRS